MSEEISSTVIEALSPKGECRHKKLDEERILANVLEGVKSANQKCSKEFYVSKIQYVENDTGPEEIFNFLAQQIVEYLVKDEIFNEKAELPDAQAPYSREEILAAGDAAPERGMLCYKCKTIIPQFRDLTEYDKTRIIKLISENKHLLAMKELQAATGCSLTWAKIWVQHAGESNETPCPYCGKTLRTATAKQCRYCLKDWH